MLICLPVSLRSWDCEVEGAASGVVELSFRDDGGRGHLRMEDVQYAVRRHAGEARWTLEDNSRVWMEASMPEPTAGSFEISGMGHEIKVGLKPGHRRSFVVIQDGQMAGGIRRAHFFTRRAFIECRAEVPEMAQFFAFWLVSVFWRKGGAMART